MKSVHIGFSDDSMIPPKIFKEVLDTEFVGEFYSLLTKGGAVLYIKRDLIATIAEKEEPPSE